MIKEFTPISYRRATFESSYDAIVVGSGIGGLTAAILLAKHAGKRVLVLERHYKAGGFTHVFRRPGYEWDVGVHYVGEVQDRQSLIYKIFDHLTDGHLRWSNMPDVYDRILIGDRAYDFPTGVERFRQRMKGYFPEEARAIDKYITAVVECVGRMGFFFAEKVIPPAFRATQGEMMRRPFLEYANRTTADVLRSFTNNAELIAVLTGQWGDYGLPPEQSSFGIHAAIAKHYFEGGSYPVGGSGEILGSMAPIIERYGGTVIVNAEVDSILVEQNRAVGVRMADGAEIRAPLVVSDAGAPNTYKRLLRENSPQIDAVRKELNGIPPSICHLALYVGLDGTASELNIEGTNLWVYPDADHDGNVRRFFADPQLEFPAVYMSFPSAKDPTFVERFPGHSTIDLLTVVPYDWFTRWEQTQWRKRDSEYDEFKQRLQSRLLDVLYRQVPAARGRVKHVELSTPLTTRHFTAHPHGEIYGLAHTPERLRSKAIGPVTPVRNLYLTGQDAAVCGVVGAVTGGFLAASAVLGKDMFTVVNKRAPLPTRSRVSAREGVLASR